MKAIVILFIVFTSSYPQSIEQISPYPSGELNSDLFINNGKVKYTVSYINGFYKTNDTIIIDYLSLPTDRLILYLEGSVLDTNLILANTYNTLIMSIDGGKNWKIIENDTISNFSSKFKVNPQNPNVIYNSRHLNELWKTYDKGMNWQKIHTFTIDQINYFAIAPTDTSFIYCSTTGGVYLSTNSGLTFNKRSSVYSEKIKVNPLNKHTVYIRGSGDIKKSMDAGLTFSRISHPVYSVIDFEINFADTNKIFIAKAHLPNDFIGLYKTSNEGLNWQPLTVANGLFDQYGCGEISFDPNNPDILYAGISSRGIYKTTDGGESFQTTKLLTSIPLDVQFLSDNEFVVGCVGWGIWKTLDSGKNWYLPDGVDYGFNATSIDFAPDNKNYGIAAGRDKTVLRTTNGGDSWYSISDGFGASEVYFHPKAKGVVFISGWVDMGLGDIFTLRSTDYGVSWSRVLDDTCLRRIAFDPNNSNVVYGLSNEYGGVFKSSNTGQTWTRMYPGGNVFLDIAIDNQSTIFIGNRGSLLMSNDHGVTWKNIDSSLKVIDQMAKIVALWADPTKSGRLYAGLYWAGAPFSANYGGGLYLSENFGKSWRRVTKEHVAYFVKKNGDYIYMDNRFGLTRFLDTLTVTGVNDDKEFKVADTYYITQNYPNPFNPSTTINYELPKSGMVSLKVYNILGKEVATLVNEYKPAGNYSVQFNATGLTSGVYFYKLNTEGYSSVRKMLLIK